MPVATITQLPPPTQVSLVATPLPGTSALRVLPDSVAPSVSVPSIGPDGKGNGVYASPPAPSTSFTPIAPPLATLIPSSLSTSSATLGASAIFATQLLSQDVPGAVEFLAVYEALVAASQVKYKPSNAALPEPAANNLFAKLLAEEKTQGVVRESIQQQVVKQPTVQAATQNIASPPPAPKARAETSASPSLSNVRYASQIYQSTSSRNKHFLEDEATIEAVSG